MTETQKRIEAYQKVLPDIKEKVAAVAMLLALSVIMLTSASFAWLTISRAPEVTSVATNVAANGNLEIALATGDGTTPPGESKVGDSMAAEVKDGENPITRANITWGNLINLNDPSYGLEQLVLKPAQLNRLSLSESPLFGAEYTDDGRIKRLSSDFAYTSWQIPEGSNQGKFAVENTTMGVRAISSVEVEFLSLGEKQRLYMERLVAAMDKNNIAASSYAALADNTGYMDSLSAMMGKFLTASLNGADSVDDFAPNDVQNLRKMYEDFLACYDIEAEAIAELINVQMDMLELTDDKYTAEKVYQFNERTNPLPEGVVITNLKEFIDDRNIIKKDMGVLDELLESGELTYAAFEREQIIDHLVDVSICTVNGTQVKVLSADKSQAAGLVMDKSKKDVRITNGILKRFEERTGGEIDVEKMTIEAFYLIEVTITARVRTNMDHETTVSYFESDKVAAESGLGNVGKKLQTAQDTYGLAVDVWVRTNTANSYLTLEGNVLTETETVKATGKDPNGNTVDIYTISRIEDDDNGDSVISLSTTYDLYSIISEGENGEEVTTWYNAETHAVFELESGEEPRLKMVDIVTVIGYEGENRVWGENSGKGLSVDATTQGSGSCYVYYADTPEDMYRSLDLLKAMRVAFVNNEGRLLAQAKMDTEKYFAKSGRVIVPLVLDPFESIEIGTNTEGEKLYGITLLERNTAVRVTAIVYLDGTELSNEDVLSAANIQGQLNIQFGNSQNLEPIDNEKLESEYRTISATVTRADGESGNFNFDTDTDLSVNIEVLVDGEPPKNMEAFFVRQVSSTQGSREEAFGLSDPDGDKKWNGNYTFTAPGKYVLRTVKLNGQEYVLSEPQEIIVEGFNIRYLDYGNTSGDVSEDNLKIMTAGSSGSAELRLKFETDDPKKMPTSVHGRFLREDGSAVNVTFIYNTVSTEWEGSATFITSGSYTMQYLVLDGEYTEIDSSHWKYADVTLGMRAEIYTTSPQMFKYEPSEWGEPGSEEYQKKALLGMQVKIFDNAGNEMPGLDGAELIYAKRGSLTNTMYTKLTWDGTYYVGEFTNGGVGIWEFETVEVGDNDLTAATVSPVFTIQSPEPPKYVSAGASGDRFVPDGDAVMTATMEYTTTATVVGVMTNSKEPGKEYLVTGTAVDRADDITTDWSFGIPKTNNYNDLRETQDGNWTLKEIRVSDYYNEKGEYIGAEATPMIIDIEEREKRQYKLKVVQTIFVDFNGEDITFSEQNFLEPYNFNASDEKALNVEIYNFEGEPVDNLSADNVKFEFAYVTGSSKTNGGYEMVNSSGEDILTYATAGATVSITLGSQNDVDYDQSTEASFLYAGDYTASFSFMVGGKTYTNTSPNVRASGELPTVTVSTVAPGVKVSEVTPSGQIKTYISYAKDEEPDGNYTLSTDVTNGWDDKLNVWNVFAKATTSKSDGAFGVGTSDAGFVLPTIVFEAQGLLNDNYILEFTIPATDNLSAKIVSITGNTTSKKITLGDNTKQHAEHEGCATTSSVYEYYGYGTIVISKVTVKHNNITYMIYLKNPIVIENPSSIPNH